MSPAFLLGLFRRLLVPFRLLALEDALDDLADGLGVHGDVLVPG